MVKHTVVSSKELGTRCWSTARFITGERCPRVMHCKYPEKKSCKAVLAEIDHLQQQRNKFLERFHAKLSKLIAERTLRVTK